jgi:hypothetical protein
MRGYGGKLKWQIGAACTPYWRSLSAEPLPGHNSHRSPRRLKEGVITHGPHKTSHNLTLTPLQTIVP